MVAMLPVGMPGRASVAGGVLVSAAGLAEDPAAGNSAGRPSPSAGAASSTASLVAVLAGAGSATFLGGAVVGEAQPAVGVRQVPTCVTKLLSRIVRVLPFAALTVVKRPGESRIRRLPVRKTARTSAESPLVRLAVRVPSQALVKVTRGAMVHAVVPPAYRAGHPVERLPAHHRTLQQVLG